MCPVRFESPTAVMRHALTLAARGTGRVEPNPAVGAVLVDEQLTQLGEGWHERFGGPHAEIHAIASAGERCRGATLYCTLEPCAHWGQTPPCADAVIAAGIRRVVVALRDPFPAVDGRGIERLRAAGIEVEVGLLEAEARQLVKPFLTLTTLQRPWVLAKWAMSLDGRIATRTGHSQWISNELSRAQVHALRGRMDAILVGAGTVLADDPLLTARPAGPRVATRVVLDGRGRLPPDCQLTRTVDVAPLLIATSTASPVEWRTAVTARGAEVIVLPADAGSGRIRMAELLAEFGRRRWTNLLVEGGGDTLGAFFDADLVDECHVFVAPKLIGGQGAPGPVGGRGLELVGPAWQVESHARLGDDLFIRAQRVRS